MGIIIGLVITLGCVLGGYMAMGGYLSVLNQPFEFVIIGGAAIGTFIVANPMAVVKGQLQGPLVEAIKNAVPKDSDYPGTAGLAASFASRTQKPSHAAKWKATSDSPEESSIFQDYPSIMKDHELTNFI